MNLPSISHGSRRVCAAMILLGAVLAGASDCAAQAGSFDARSLREFHQGLIANTRTAEIARNRAWSGSVRRVADNAARDLRRTRLNIESVARQNRISLTSGFSSQGRSLVNRISSTPASSFDRVYLDNTTQQMRRLQRAAQNGSRSARNASLRTAYQRSITVFNRIAADARSAQARL